MKELINYRRQKAKESFAAAKILYKNGNFFSAVNRLYYAVFYQVTALLLTKGFASSKHSGVMALFNKEFVKTGIITKKSGKFYGRLFELRQEGDYADFT